MAISKDKKRYNVTLTPANVDRFQALVKDLGMPSTTMSAALDDSLRALADTFQVAKDRKGNFGIADIFKMVGEQTEMIIKEERREAIEQDRKKTPRRSKIAKA